MRNGEKIKHLNEDSPCSYDMGWSKRSSGNRYDSSSGHSFMVGCLSDKIIAARVTSKGYRKCSSSEKKGDKITNPMHRCQKIILGPLKDWRVLLMH